MKKEFDLDFCFKGSRKYVHGTDIYTKLIQYQDKDVSKIDILFHGIATNNMTFSPDKPSVDEVKVKLFGIENNKIVNCRYEYIEEKVITNSTVDVTEETINLNKQTEFSFIEHIVAMNKALLEKLYSTIEGKWYFTRLQLNKTILMEDVSSLKITLKSNFQFKLTKSAIIVNNEEVGFIYFSLVNKES